MNVKYTDGTTNSPIYQWTVINTITALFQHKQSDLPMNGY